MADVQPLRDESPAPPPPDAEGRRIRRAKTEAETEKLRAETKALNSRWLRVFEALKALGAVAATVLAGYAALTTYRVSQLETKMAAKEKAEIEAQASVAKKQLADTQTKLAATEGSVRDKTKRLEEKDRALRLADTRVTSTRKAVEQNVAIPEATRRSLKARLDGVSDTLQGKAIQDDSDVWKAADAYSASPASKAIVDADKILRDADQQLRRIHRDIAAERLPTYAESQTGWNIDAPNLRLENWLALTKPAHQQPVWWTKYTYRILNNDLVFSTLSDGKVFYRTKASAPDYGDDFKAAVKASMAPQLKAEMNRTD